jgi:hypothetical protein
MIKRIFILIGGFKVIGRLINEARLKRHFIFSDWAHKYKYRSVIPSEGSGTVVDQHKTH